MPPGLAELVAGYTGWEPGRNEVVFSRAALPAETPAGTGQTLLQVGDVVRPGDLVDAWIEPASLRPRRIEVLTELDGEPVRIVTEYTDLPGGPTFPSRRIVETRVAELPMIVEMLNFDVQRRGSSR